MNSYCKMCGEKVYNKKCINCHSAHYLAEEYLDLDMTIPDSVLREMKEQPLK